MDERTTFLTLLATEKQRTTCYDLVLCRTSFFPVASNRSRFPLARQITVLAAFLGSLSRPCSGIDQANVPPERGDRVPIVKISRYRLNVQLMFVDRIA